MEDNLNTRLSSLITQHGVCVGTGPDDRSTRIERLSRCHARHQLYSSILMLKNLHNGGLWTRGVTIEGRQFWSDRRVV